MVTRFENINGLIGSSFQFTNGAGPQLKNSSGVIEARNTADDAYAIVRTATAVNNNDALTKAQFDDHSARHESGGGDAIKLDDFAAPDDNTDLNASTDKHGLLPKLGGGTTNYLRADGTWAAPAGSATFGSQYHSATSEGEDTTTSTSYQTKLTLTTSSLPSGTYLLSWSAEVGNSQRDRDTLVKISDASVGTLNEARKGKVDTDGGYTILSGSYELASISGVRTITMGYKVNTTDTAKIRCARFTFWRIS